MGLISSLITKIRYEMQDSVAEDLDSDKLVSMIGDAVERINHILIKNSIQFAKKSATFTTVADQQEYLFADMTSAVDDLLVHEGLFRRSKDLEVTFLSDREWENVVSCSDIANWRYNSGMTGIELLATPSTATADETMAFYYWPTIDTSAYATTTSLPWSGRMDQAVKEYVCYRLKNQDEFNLSDDKQILDDIVSSYVATYTGLVTKNGGILGWDGR